MARARWSPRVSARSRTPALIAVDGIDNAAILAAAHNAIGAVGGGLQGGVSRWDASGVFEELMLAGAGAGRPSARTLLLLYAADLAFRLRWEIRPTLAEGRTVVAAPYVDTAAAFGRAAGLPAAWIANLFQFAPAPSSRLVDASGPRRISRRHGFVEFACRHIARQRDRTPQDLVDRTRAHLLTRRRSSRR
jgi:hypothetical protein